ncbi:MAG: polysaccharide biosynthesis C-terminal domain-containing protein, partial [Clostridia bacterium]|nr:polysaccharide biosynthesis C-terminal domain-containing protein [Clostridia bacterium]
PEMSRCFARGDLQEAKEICRGMLSTISAIVLPIMAFLAGNARPVIRLLYQGDHFTAEDTVRVGTLLSIYTIAMIFYSYQEILNKYFYSMQKVKLPVITAFAGIGVNLGVSLLTVDSLGVYGLALGTVSAAIVMAGMLWIFTARVTPGVLNRKLFFSIGKDLVAAMGLFIAAREVRIVLESQISGVWGTLMGLFGGLIAGLLLYLLVLKLLGSEDLKKITGMLKKTEK